MAKSIRISFLALAAALVAAALWAATASAEVVYSAPASSSSGGMNFTETEAVGSLVRPIGTDRVNPTVSLGLQVTSDEATEPFEVPMTLRIYAVNGDQSPGAVLAEANAQAKFAGQGTSQVVWTLAGTTLPSEAIVAVSFDGKAVPAAFAEVLFAEPTIGMPAATIYVAENGEPLEAEGEPGEISEFQPAFTIEAEAPATLPPPSTGSVETAPPTSAATTPAATAPVVTIPSGPSLALRRHRMKVSFPQSSARLGGPGALVQLKCEGSAAARCTGTLTLSILGQTHKVPFSIPKGRKQYVVVPLGDDLERIDGLHSPRAVVTARTLQERGGSVKTSQALKLR